MISNLEMERFKKFESGTVDLGPFTILMGENSSGKTSILQAINVAQGVLHANEFVGVDPDGTVWIRDRGVGLTTIPGMSTADNRELFYAKRSRGGAGGGSTGAVLILSDDADCRYRLQIRELFGGLNIKCISQTADFPNIPTLQETRPLLISGFVGLLSTEERSFPAAISDRLNSGKISAIIRNLLLDTFEESPDKFRKLQRRLASDFGFELEVVEFNQKQDLYVTASYGEEVSGEHVSFDFNASGSGFMQVLQILTPIYRYCPEQSNVVLLDEPDAHLHSNLQRTLAAALREIQQELGIQMIISTHSTSIIRSATASEVVPVTSRTPRMSALSKSSQVEDNIRDHLDSYVLGKSVISGKILFLEDANTQVYERVDSELGTRVLNGANTIPVLSGRSKDDKTPFNSPELLALYLSEPVKVHFIRDRDGLPDHIVEKLVEYGKEKEVTVHILGRHEIENYLLEPSVLSRAIANVAGSLYTPGVEEIRNQLSEFLASTITKSRYRYDHSLEDSILKAANVCGITDLRSPSAAKSKAIQVREEYEKLTDFEDLVAVGMGKEALGMLMKWINEDLKIQFSRTMLVAAYCADDVHPDLRTIFSAVGA